MEERLIAYVIKGHYLDSDNNVITCVLDLLVQQYEQAMVDFGYDRHSIEELFLENCGSEYCVDLVCDIHCETLL